MVELNKKQLLKEARESIGFGAEKLLQKEFIIRKKWNHHAFLLYRTAPPPKFEI